MQTPSHLSTPFTPDSRHSRTPFTPDSRLSQDESDVAMELLADGTFVPIIGAKEEEEAAKEAAKAKA